ncbi:Had-superfamily subfamily variant 1 [Colletotrichum higginsianum IMI 349063]|uniref:Had-superfamily subfamily variant 1 n=1 Tax=Colletotrichum higginsianum (strain IMI 349063) TaxID=759273 RepID=A0A1B7YS81_COLHI|nr:Had-superfamily subfamily variant 1 [Colletotrichum higginsianum IMI 349063]OBR14897.1 Had-superfamily subfamily variant 1 [Colletotrichum higginsianum IMI 349063]
MEPTRHNIAAVLFDLDGTLFDHHHSLGSAISTVQQKYDSFSGENTQDLISKYNISLQKAYDEYLRNRITYQEADSRKIRLFFNEVGLPEPTAQQITEFRNVYKPAYQKSRRATPDSVEMLIRLREHGFRLGIVTNGQLKDQLEKSDAIGVRHLVDNIITSEEAGCCKPDKRLFHLAIEALGATLQNSYMIGDSVDSDIRGGLECGIETILYSPVATDSTRVLFGTPVSVIRSMSQLPGYLNFSLPRFAPNIAYQNSLVVAEGIGMDLITEPRHCLWLPKNTVHDLAKELSAVLAGISVENYVFAILRTEGMVRTVAKAASPINETAIRISYRGQGEQMNEPSTHVRFHITERLHSIRIDYEKCILSSKSCIEARLLESLRLLQACCDNLMRDYPRAALRNLRSVMMILAEIAGTQASLVVEGEGIEL